VKLPAKLSELIRVAVEDARSVEHHPKYVLDMSAWHTPSPELGKCRVCMAGAVMACRLGVDPGTRVVPGLLNENFQLYAVNMVRTGDIVAALRYIDIRSREQNVKDIIADIGGKLRFKFDALLGRASWEDYLEAADKLAELGL